MKYLFLFLLIPLISFAQDAGNRTCRALFLNPPAGAPDSLFLHDGVTCQEVALSKMNFSDVQRISGGDITVRLLTKPVEKAQDIPANAPSAKVPAAMADIYLVLMADLSNKESPVRIQVLDATEKGFRKGEAMWYNLSSFSVGGQLGTEKLAMKPQSKVFTKAPAADKASYPVNLSYLRPGDPTFYPIAQTQWQHDARSRMVMFVYGGGGNQAPTIAGFKDFREAPKPN